MKDVINKFRLTKKFNKSYISFKKIEKLNLKIIFKKIKLMIVNQVEILMKSSKKIREQNKIKIT